MALFSNTPKKTVKKTAAPKAAAKKLPEDGRLENVLVAPWLSEKALIGTESGVYVFEVPARATKTDVKAAVELIYKVKPTKIRMVNLPAKKVSLRTRRGIGSRARRHKAYVYLKKGETIQFA
jgi:large subunit ribosomal protein L23